MYGKSYCIRCYLPGERKREWCIHTFLVGMHTFSFIDSNHWNTKYSLFYGWKVIQGLLSFRITFYLVTLDE